MTNTEQYLQKHGYGEFSPRAVLFDMDGVIYDSMPRHAVAWRDAMAHFGLTMPYEGAYEYEGMRGVETIQLLARQQWHREMGDDEAREMYAHKSALFAQLCQDEPVGIMPGIRDVMEQIHQNGWQICIVTGSAQRTMLDRLLHDFAGLVSEQRIVTAFDVTRGKPQPEPYLKGLEKCGLEPWQAIVVENAPLGVQAAVSAGCFTIAVNTGPLPEAMLRDAGADVIFPRMTALADAYRQWYPSGYRG